MRQKLLLLLVRNGYEPIEAANIVGILLTDPYLGPLLSGGPVHKIPQGPFVQQLPEGVFYFSPSK